MPPAAIAAEVALRGGREGGMRINLATLIVTTAIGAVVWRVTDWILDRLAVEAQ